MHSEILPQYANNDRCIYICVCVGAALFQMTVVLHNDVGELPAATTNKKNNIPSPQWLVSLATMRKGEEEKRREKNNPRKGQKRKSPG